MRRLSAMIVSPAMVLLLAVLAGCQPKTDIPPDSQSAAPTEAPPTNAQPVATRDRTALPSMSSYILNQSPGKQNTPPSSARPSSAQPEDPIRGQMQTQVRGVQIQERRQDRLANGASGGVDPSANPELSPGQYCFHEEKGENWLSIRFAISTDQQITGESAGTVTHPQKGQTPYRQSFAGQLTNGEALVDVTTYIDGVTRSRQEAWRVNPDQLDLGRLSVNGKPCADVSANF
ncbi:MAG: hypothetical protein WBC73_15720 [Phormidesmis sp.]